MKILIAVDGSSQSTHLAQALRAFSPGHEIFLLHVIHVPQLAYPGTGMTVGHAFVKQAKEAMHTEGMGILEEMTSKIPPDVGKVHKRIKPGPPAEVILDLAGEEKVDLMIIGSRGLGMIREHALGSVSHRVATHSRCSTLVIKSSMGQLKHVQIPIEHKEDGDQAIEFLSERPFPKAVHISLLHVIPFLQAALPIGALIPETFKKELRDGAEQFLGDLAARVSSLGYSASFDVIAGAPSHSIRERAQAKNVDLIMMGIRRERALNRFLFGSVSHSVLHHASCSVLLLK